MSFLAPPLRAIAQLSDPAFVRVLGRSLLWTLVGFIALAIGLGRGVDLLLSQHAAFIGEAWLAGLLGGVGAMLLAYYFFLPLAGLIAMLLLDPIAEAVERRWYPGLPPARPASLASQAWDGIALGLRAFAWQAVVLLLALIPALAPIAAPLGWLVAAWSVGRGLFVAVAMRRMARPAATTLYVHCRPAVLAQGALMALGSLVPFVNLLIPVLGTAAMVHVLHESD